MSAAPFYVLGNAGTADPWVLSLDGFPSKERAQRAINWQLIGERDPPEYWGVVTLAELRALVPSLSRNPYTVAAFEQFLERVK